MSLVPVTPLALLIACEPAPTEPAPGLPGDGPAYLAATRVFSTDGADVTSYFHLVDSLDAGATIDPSVALEVGGSAKLYSIPDVGWFAIGNGESPVLTRYELDDDGRLVAGEELSLSNEGVGYLWDTIYVVSPTKVYYPDRDGSQIVIIDPTAMTIEGSIPLPDTIREGYLSLYGYAGIERDGALLVSVAWFDWYDDRVLGETGLVTIDTATDTVLGMEVDDRCGGVTQPVTLASGDTLLASSALAAGAHALGTLDTAPCALRVRADAQTFDPDYAPSLSDVAGAGLVGDPIPAGGEAVFLRTFDEATGDLGAAAFSWEVTSQSAWRWATWDVASDVVAPVDSLPPSTADVLWFQVDDRVYGTQTLPDYSETTLVELTADGGPRDGLTAPGFLHNVARLR